MKKECRNCRGYYGKENECGNPDGPKWLEDVLPEDTCEAFRNREPSWSGFLQERFSKTE